MSRPTPGRHGRPGALGVIAAVVRVNALRLLRDPIGLAFIVAVPFLLILVIGVTLPDAGERRPVGLVVEDDDAIATRVAEALGEDEGLQLTRYADADALRAAVRRGIEVAGVVASPDDVDADGGRRVTYLHDPGRAPQLAVRAAVRAAVTRSGVAARAVTQLSERTGLSPEAAEAALDAVPVFGGVEVDATSPDATGASPLPGGFAYAAPAYLVLFMFINTLVAAWGLPADRASGVTRRHAASPAGATAVALGEAVYRGAVALGQAALIVLVGGLVFGVPWGDPLAVAALVGAFALVCTAFSMALGSWAETPEQVTALAPPVGIALGMLGGCMWPLEVVGPTLRTVGFATPHAWAVSAFQDVIGSGADVVAIAPQLGVLVAFAAGAGLLAALAQRWRARR